jgi:hypothetical protein
LTLKTTSIGLNMMKDGKLIVGEERKAVFSGLAGGTGLSLYLYGYISYHDILGTDKTYTSIFCGIYNPGTKLFDVCRTHNQIN